MKIKQLLAITTILTVLLLSAASVGAFAETEAKPVYYLTENEERYDFFIAEHLDIPPETAIAYVNAAADKDFYSDVEITANPESTLVLLNKNYTLPSSYIPPELVSIGGHHRLRSDAAAHFQRMCADAARENLNLVVYSAYRSYSDQNAVYNSYTRGSSQTYADSFSARPGHSEHQTGLAVDILHKPGNSGFRSAVFQKTGEFAWLLQNAYKYGFILRYPDGFSNITGYTFEPWHWRFIGVHAATVMRDESIVTYEEYYGKYLAAGSVNSASDSAVPINFSVSAGDTLSVLEAYRIDGRNYFKLRDIAFLLSQTEFRFDILWQDKSAAIELVNNKHYSGESDYEIIRRGVPARYTTGARIISDDNSNSIAVQNVAGSSYIGLYDLCAVLNIPLEWDGESDTVFIGGIS